MRYLIFPVLILLAACGKTDAPASEAPAVQAARPEVFTVNYPLAWAAKELAGAAADVVFPAPPNVDPAYWEPDLETIAAYQQADLILLNGANYARWIARVSLPQNRLLDTSKDFADRYLEVTSGPVHSHGPEGAHSHGELAFTLWLDLELYARQVDAVARGLAALLPAQQTDIEERRIALLERLEALDDELLQAGKQLDGAPLLYSHPVYQYLDRRYRLNGLALHWEPGIAPDERAWPELDSVLARHPARLMLWEGEPAPEARAGLEQRGIAVIVLPPMGNRPQQAGFIENLAAAAAALNVAATRIDK